MENANFKCQIIDENMNYQQEAENILINLEKQIKLSSDYRVLSVIGNQSTGKSTIFNCLFGCNFDVLDSSKGRKQTTKGEPLKCILDTKIAFFRNMGRDYSRI